MSTLAQGAHQPRPSVGDAWTSKATGMHLLITTVYGGYVLGRQWTDCPEAVCDLCASTTHAGTHLSEKEHGYKEQDFTQAFVWRTSPMWTGRGSRTQRREVMSEKKVLWKFYWDCRRMGSVEGVFVATEAQVKEAIGKRVYFGEILGKHSEVQGVLEEKDLKRLTDDQDFIAKAETYGIASTGYNPLNHLPEEEADDD